MLLCVDPMDQTLAWLDVPISEELTSEPSKLMSESNRLKSDPTMLTSDLSNLITDPKMLTSDPSRLTSEFLDKSQAAPVSLAAAALAPVSSLELDEVMAMILEEQDSTRELGTADSVSGCEGSVMFSELSAKHRQGRAAYSWGGLMGDGDQTDGSRSAFLLNAWYELNKEQGYITASDRKQAYNTASDKKQACITASDKKQACITASDRKQACITALLTAPLQQTDSESEDDSSDEDFVPPPRRSKESKRGSQRGGSGGQRTPRPKGGRKEEREGPPSRSSRLKEYARLSKAQRWQRKKEQNKNAAIKYRERKRVEEWQRGSEVDVLERRNAALRREVSDKQREVNVLRTLVIDIFRSGPSARPGPLPPALGGAARGGRQ